MQSGREKENRYRVLHLVSEFSRDIPLFVNLIQGIDNALFNHIICYLGEQDDTPNVLSELGYEVMYLGFRRRTLRRFTPSIIPRLVSILRTKRIDIIHCQRHKATLYGALASRLAGRVPVVSHVHGLNRTRSLRRRLANWLLWRHVRRIITVSDSVRQNVLESNWAIDPEKVITVRNGIDISVIDSARTSRNDARRMLGIHGDDIVFGTVGRLVKTKGQRYLIEAFSRARKTIPGARLVIVGDGYLSYELQRQCEASGVASSVLFTGYRTDVRTLLCAFDVFVLTSIAEGLSLALLEAMAARLPVIASSVGGIPEVFGDKRIGRLVPARDEAALEQAMIEIALLSAQEKKTLGDNARRRVEAEFTAAIMCRRLAEAYRSVLSPNRDRTP